MLEPGVCSSRCSQLHNNCAHRWVLPITGTLKEMSWSWFGYRRGVHGLLAVIKSFRRGSFGTWLSRKPTPKLLFPTVRTLFMFCRRLSPRCKRYWFISSIWYAMCQRAPIAIRRALVIKMKSSWETLYASTLDEGSMQQVRMLKWFQVYRTSLSLVLRCQ